MANHGDSVDAGIVEDVVVLSRSNSSNSLDLNVVDHNAEESSDSDTESGVTGNNAGRSHLCEDELIKLDCVADRNLCEIIKGRFESGLGTLGVYTTVVDIHRIAHSSVMGQARLKAFQIYSQAMKEKCEGYANTRYAWYGVSKNGVNRILTHGFGQDENLETDRLCRYGVHLSSDSSPIESLKCSSMDEDGMRYILLCRVLLGKMEVINPGSEQTRPSSSEFDSGVDDLIAPKKYIIWSTNMNTHIFPEYVLTCKAPSCLKGFVCPQIQVKKPASPWMPLPALLSALSKFFPPSTIALITKYYSYYRARKISRQELIRRMRQLTGDELLIRIVKCFNSKVKQTLE